MSNQIIDIQIPPYKPVQVISGVEIRRRAWEAKKKVIDFLKSQGVSDIEEEEDPFEREQKIREKMREGTSRIIEPSKDFYPIEK